MVTNVGNPYPAYFQPTGDGLIDATTNGYFWKVDESRTIDIALANGFDGEYWHEPAQMALWLTTVSEEISYYTNIKFNFSGFYVNPIVAASSGAEITLSADARYLLFNSSDSWALGFFPNSSVDALYPGAPGDIYINFKSEANYLPSYELGSQGWFLLLHEMGHALGLKHPHDDGGTGRPTFNSAGFGQMDTDIMTVMSYDDDAKWNYFSWDPATPMILDVYALQYLYGKNTEVNSGNDTFTLTDDNLYLTIWDPSGADAVDASKSTVGWTIYLPEESLSNLSDTRAGIAVPTRDWYSSVPQTLRWLAGDYENVIGSGYADTINGNLFANMLYGGQGNDTIFGAGGNDFIDGGFGIDTAKYKGTSSSYSITASPGGSGVEVLSAAEGQDTLLNVEKIQFTDGTFNIGELIQATASTPSRSLQIEDFLLLEQATKQGEILNPYEHVLTIHLVFTGKGPSATDYNNNKAYINANGMNAYVAAVGGVNANVSDKALAISVLSSLGLQNIWTSQQMEAYLAANSNVRVQAILDLASAVSNYGGSDKDMLAVKASYNAAISEAYLDASKLVSDVPASAASYSISSNFSNADEGGTASFTLTTKNVTAGTAVPYTISGVSAADISGSLSGTALVNTSGVATISVTLVNDNLTEGAETLTATAGGASASTTVNDTSKTVVAGNTLDVIVDLFGTVSMLKGLIELDNGTVHTVAHNGTAFNYAEIDPLITTVVRNGEFTAEFAQEIADAYPSAAGIKYNTVVSLVGAAAIDDLLMSVAGSDGSYVS